MGSSSSPPSVLLLVLFSLVCIMEVLQAQNSTFNVMKYGAVADGETDNSKAFSDVWNQACKSEGQNVILIPSGTYLLDPIVFKGPCKGPIEFQVQGVIKASTDESSLNIDHWITFQYVDHLTITGGGSFDGQGASAWSHNTCLKDPNCPLLPVSIRLDFVNYAWIHDISSINSKNFHFNIFESNNTKINHVTITAPGDSPNTDGIHIAMSKNVDISDSDISTGDDCISMGPGSQNINITNINCGPGHGISIGSLGGSPNEEAVTQVTVKNTTFTGTSNGVRIKTWAHSYPGTVSDITFEDINVNFTENPIIIDQQYCPSSDCSQKDSSSVQISHVTFNNIWGTSTSKVALNLDCSQSTPCENIELKDINIAYNGGGDATSTCTNVHGAAYGQQIPPSCIKN